MARPGHFNHLPRKEIRYLSYRKLGFYRVLSWRVPKNSAQPGLKPRAVHQAASCYVYSDCAVPVAKFFKEIFKNIKFKIIIQYGNLKLGFILFVIYFFKYQLNNIEGFCSFINGTEN